MPIEKKINSSIFSVKVCDVSNDIHKVPGIKILFSDDTEQEIDNNTLLDMINCYIDRNNLY